MDDPQIPEGCKLIGWMGVDDDGPNSYESRPVVHEGDPDCFFDDNVACNLYGLIENTCQHIPHMHAVPIYLGPVVDLRPVAEFVWLRAGDCAIAAQNGFTLCVTRLTVTFAAEVHHDAFPHEYRNFDGRQEAEDWAAATARELGSASSRTA